MAVNSVALCGNLTRDPEMRKTSGGMPVMGFGVAVNERRKSASGEWEDYPNFIGCTMFGSRAEALSRYLRKGSKVAVSGHLHYSAWDGKDGSKRSKLEVVVEELDFMSSGGSRQGQQQRKGGPAYAVPPKQDAPAQAHGPEQPELYDEEIPF